MTKSENWLPVVGYEGMYSVGDLGRVRSEVRIVARSDGGALSVRERILKVGRDGGGYLHVTLFAGSERKIRYVAHLVAAAFIGPRPHKYEVCHNDGDKTNNAASNLRYDTRTGNSADKVIHGTHNRGSRNGAAKLNESQAFAVFHDKRIQRVIAKNYGVSQITVSQIKTGKNWASALQTIQVAA